MQDFVFLQGGFMKKVFACFAALVLALALAGCAPKTEYDDKELVKIEYHGGDGMGLWGINDYRVFDFEKNIVYDITIAEEEALQEMINRAEEGQIEEILQRYNNPKTVATFTEEQEEAFVAHIRKAGIYGWKDSYKTDEVIDDGAGFSLELTFSDDSVKRTDFYYKYPRNLKKIQSYFLSDLGADMRHNR